MWEFLGNIVLICVGLALLSFVFDLIVTGVLMVVGVIAMVVGIVYAGIYEGYNMIRRR